MFIMNNIVYHVVSCGTKGTMAGVLVTVPSNGISGGGGHRGPKTKYQ